MIKIRLFPILILVLGLVVTFLISYSAFQDNEEIQKQTFQNLCQSFENKIFIQLNSNAQILYNSAAFISSSDTVARDEWNEYQFLNKSFREVPGIQGIGYTVIVDKTNLQKFEKRIRDEGFPEFEIYPKQARDFYTAVMYIEPMSNHNLQMLGFDGFTETIRQKVMEESKNKDIAIISDKLIYAPEPAIDNQAETVMYYPVFKHKIVSGKAEERHLTLSGWVFTPFRMDDLLSGIMKKWEDQNLRLKIYDNQFPEEEKLLFDSDSTFNLSHDSNIQLNHQIKLEFNGKTWLLNFSQYRNDEVLLPAKIVIILVEGIFASLLLFILAVSLILARKKSNEIQVLNNELQNANVNKDRFITVLAHDLKSPFNSLLGFSELLSTHLNSLDNDELEMYVNRVYSSAQVAYLLLDELLMWARVQSDQFPFNPERLNINKVCKKMTDDHKLVAANKHISINFDEEETVYVMADDLMLKTILRNLVVNAIKFTKERGSISISFAKSIDMIIVCVSDTGIGISAEGKQKLFDKTQIYSSNGTANEKGTGLGLMLCKDLVLKHKGEIWVESILGQGSSFKFTIPLAPEQNES